MVVVRLPQHLMLPSMRIPQPKEPALLMEIWVNRPDTVVTKRPQQCTVWSRATPHVAESAVDICTKVTFYRAK